MSGISLIPHDPGFSSAEASPLLLALGDGSPICGGVCLDIHPEDEMLRLLYYRVGADRERALWMYFESGLRIWSALERVLVWRFGSLARVGRVLDFAAGYGRVTRFAAHALPPNALWVAEIEGPAVDFQVGTFGVHGILSTTDPGELVCSETFDAILVSSLFTHLPRVTFEGWLRRLGGLLRPGGVLAFSVHDEAVLRDGTELPADGLLFVPSSESRVLDTAQYGSTWVTERCVRELLASALPGASVARVAKGLASYQDLYVVVPEAGADFSGLRLRAGPDWHLDRCGATSSGYLELAGWVIDRASGRAVRRVRVDLGGQPWQSISELTPRPDVAALYPLESTQPVGWRAAARLPKGLPRDAVLRIVAEDSAGRETELFAEPLNVALLRGARFELFVATRAAQIAAAESAAALATANEAAALAAAAARRREVELEARIAAMRASFFWRLRDRWFGLKRALRLTDEP